MSLLKKAKKVRKKGSGSENASLATDEIVFDKNSGISEDDQKEILSKIELIAQENRLTVSPEILTVKAPKKGYIFPFLVNLGALCILAVGFLVLSAFYRQTESELRGEVGALRTAEAKLIQEIRRDTEEQIQRKELEISSIQSRLQEIDRERNELATNMDARIKLREEELRRALENELAVERNRLAAEGLSGAAIAERLRRFEQEKNTELTAQLDTFRRQAETERARMEADLDRLRRDFQANLTTLAAERASIAEESRKREASLQAQLAEQARALALERARGKTELTAAEAEIRTLREQRERVYLIESQIMGFFSSIRGAIGEGNFVRAKELTESLRTYLNEESLRRLPGIQQRRAMDLLTVEALSILIDGNLRRQREAAAISDVLVAGSMVEEIRTLVAQAQQAVSIGNMLGAEQIYTTALRKVPEVFTAHQHFLTKQRQSEEARIQAIERALNDAETAFRQGAHRESMSAYTRALSFLPLDSARLDPTVQNIQQSGFELLLAEQRRLATHDAAGLLVEGNRFLTEQNYPVAIIRYLTLVQRFPLSAQIPQAVEGIRRAFDSHTAQHSAQIALIDGRIRSLQQERDTLQVSLQQLRETTGSRAEFAEQLNALRTQNERERASLEQAFRVRISNMELELAELRRQNTQLAAAVPGEAISQATLEKLRQLESIERDFQALKAAYQDYAAREDSLIAAGGASRIVEAKLYLDAFLASEQIRRAFPGFDRRIRQFDRAFEDAGKNAAYMEAADIVYQLAGYNTTVERTRFINTQLAAHRGNETISDFLKTLRELIQ